MTPPPFVLSDRPPGRDEPVALEPAKNRIEHSVPPLQGSAREITRLLARDSIGG